MKPSKRLRNMLERLWQCTIFGFRSYTMHKLRNERFLLVCFSVRSKQVLCFVHGQGKKRRNIQQRAVKLHDHSSLSLRLLSNKSNRTCPSSCLVPVRLWEEDNNRMWKFYKSSSKAFTVNWFRWNPVVLRFHNCLQTDLQPFLTCPERGVLAEKLGGGVRPATQNLLYLWPKSGIIATIIITVLLDKKREWTSPRNYIGKIAPDVFE